jgi:uncharacterized protein YdeI (YjbR/CyaY-like superfamily)
MMNNSSVDSYLKDGCGRCEHYKTPACKVHLWTPVLLGLRKLVLHAGLTEEMKWGSPCYTLDGKNVLMITSLRDACALNFFKGAIITDDEGALESPGPNSHHARYLKFRSLAEFKTRRTLAEKLVGQAIEIERQGIQTAPSPKSITLPDELAAALRKSAALRKAFEALTPGRQRSHVLHISGAKQSETRERRVEKCAEHILAGRGFNERQ